MSEKYDKVMVFWLRWLLTFSTAVFLKTFEEIQLLLLYWFSAQQHTSSFRHQKLDPFYSKFRAELNDFIRSLQKQ